jgi:GGDEF domain-containing protein
VTSAPRTSEPERLVAAGEAIEADAETPLPQLDPRRPRIMQEALRAIGHGKESLWTGLAQLRRAGVTAASARLGQILQALERVRLPKWALVRVPGVESGARAPAPAADAAPPAASNPFQHASECKLELLRHLLSVTEGVLVPEMCALAPQGHAIPLADQLLEVGAGESLPLLEEMADAGLLRREPETMIHVCPECRRSQISFRELCPLCNSFDLDLQSLINHFRCAHTGVESTFMSGFDLVCPKCHRLLNQLGQDFDRPGKVFVCRACKGILEEPVLRVQCLSCAREFDSAQVEPMRIYRYHPTLLAARAVELKRLTCLDLSTVMFDSRVGLATREFLNLQTRRELERLERHGTVFATVVLGFKLHGVNYPVFREWNAQDLRQLGRAIVETLRSLDLVSQLDSSRLGLLLPDTDKKGLISARERLTSRLKDYVLSSDASQHLQLAWIDATWEDVGTGPDQVLSFFDRDPGVESDAHEPAPDAEKTAAKMEKAAGKAAKAAARKEAAKRDAGAKEPAAAAPQPAPRSAPARELTPAPTPAPEEKRGEPGRAKPEAASPAVAPVPPPEAPRATTTVDVPIGDEKVESILGQLHELLSALQRSGRGRRAGGSSGE